MLFWKWRMSMIRLMIVDDQKILLEGLVKIFEGQSHIEVVSALPFSELVEPVCDQLHPDAILLDICTPCSRVRIWLPMSVPP